MENRLRFLLNDEDVATDLGAGVTVLDYLRGHRRMVGTKETQRYDVVEYKLPRGAQLSTTGATIAALSL